MPTHVSTLTPRQLAYWGQVLQARHGSFNRSFSLLAGLGAFTGVVGFCCARSLSSSSLSYSSPAAAMPVTRAATGTPVSPPVRLITSDLLGPSSSTAHRRAPRACDARPHARAPARARAAAPTQPQRARPSSPSRARDGDEHGSPALVVRPVIKSASIARAARLASRAIDADLMTGRTTRAGEPCSSPSRARDGEEGRAR